MWARPTTTALTICGLIITTNTTTIAITSVLLLLLLLLAVVVSPGWVQETLCAVPGAIPWLPGRRGRNGTLNSLQSTHQHRILLLLPPTIIIVAIIIAIIIVIISRVRHRSRRLEDGRRRQLHGALLLVVS